MPEICGLSDPGCFLKLVETRGDDFPVGDAIEIARHRQLKNAIGNERQCILATVDLAIGYRADNPSPVLKTFLGGLDQLITDGAAGVRNKA